MEKNYEGEVASSPYPILDKENCKVAKKYPFVQGEEGGTLNALRNVLFT